MQVIATGARPATDGSGRMLRTITIDPWADASQENFVRHLKGSSVLKSGHLVAIELVPNSRHVTVVLTNFALTRRALRNAGQLPRFSFLLPEHG